MRTRTAIAVAIHLTIRALVLAPPLWVRATGTAVYLETRKMDPRSLFRGHYVILGYALAQGIVDDGPGAAPNVGHPAPPSCLYWSAAAYPLQSWCVALSTSEISKFFKYTNLRGFLGRPLVWDTITTSFLNVIGKGIGFLVPFFILFIIIVIVIIIVVVFLVFCNFNHCRFKLWSTN